MSKKPIPFSALSLVIGISSILLTGLIGVIAGIIGLSMSIAALRKYHMNPRVYTTLSFKIVRFAKICCIVGIIIPIFTLTVVIIRAVTE